MILGAADALRHLIDSVPTPMEQTEYDKELAAIREKIEESELKQACEAGQRLTMDEAIALATQAD
jgi:hypothetical protein